MESKKNDTVKSTRKSANTKTTKSSNTKNNSKKNNVTSKSTVKKKVVTPKKTAPKEMKVEKIETKKIEKEVIEEINNVKVAKIEEAKFIKQKKDRKLLFIGVIVATLGIIALLVTLVANRIIDKDFMNDSTITIMMSISIIIEGFGAFIIINES